MKTVIDVGLVVPRAGQLDFAHSMTVFAQEAERLGFDSIWCGDHVVLPADGVTDYPYSQSGTFPRSADVGFIDVYSALAFLAAVTTTIRLGSTVVVLPYRNPLVHAKTL